MSRPIGPGEGSSHTPIPQSSHQPSHEDPASSKRHAKLGELGPAWITAISGLIVALTGAGIIVGRQTAPQAEHPVSLPTSMAVISAATVQSRPVTPLPSTTESVAPIGEGVELIRCSVDLPWGYAVEIDRSGACPQPVSAGMAKGPNLGLGYSTGTIQATGNSKLAVTDASPVTYDNCKRNTRYTDNLAGGVGTTVCFYGQGTIAAMTLTAIKKDSGKYDAIDLVVWRSATS